MSDRITADGIAGEAVTIRRGANGDEAELSALAELDGALPLAGDTLLAEVDGRVWAALSLDDGRVISDPFRPAREARALLAIRAAQLGQAADAQDGTRAWRRALPTRAFL
jgi:hypothetical protein